MKLPIAVIALSIGCAVLSVQAQSARPMSERTILLDDVVGPFAPTPESRAEARKEAFAGYAWFGRQCHQTERGAALTQCLRQARQARDHQLATADGRRR